VRRLIRRLPLTLLVGHCDSGRAALRTFVRVRLELPANRWLLLQQVFTGASAARPTMRKRSALQRAAPYQSVLFERGF
jgi:hypothetical protein